MLKNTAIRIIAHAPKVVDAKKSTDITMSIFGKIKWGWVNEPHPCQYRQES